MLVCIPAAFMHHVRPPACLSIVGNQEAPSPTKIYRGKRALLAYYGGNWISGVPFRTIVWPSLKSRKPRLPFPLTWHLTEGPLQKVDLPGTLPQRLCWWEEAMDSEGPHSKGMRFTP